MQHQTERNDTDTRQWGCKSAIDVQKSEYCAKSKLVHEGVHECVYEIVLGSDVYEDMCVSPVTEWLISQLNRWLTTKYFC